MHPKLFTRLLFSIALLAFISVLHSPAFATVNIVAIGDSNTAGFLVPRANKYPTQLADILRSRGYDVAMKNSGVNGSTSSGGLRRLESDVPQGTNIAIVFFGRNDRRFGVSESRMRANLDAIVSRLRARGITVVLCDFYPFNFSDIAARHGAIYAGDFFAGVAVNGEKISQYALPDLVRHLNSAGYSVVSRRLAPYVEQAIQRGGYR
jgi:acyl-CoA thioesterase I